MSGHFIQSSEVLLPDGSTIMDTPSGTMHLTALECDACGVGMQSKERWNQWDWAAGSGYWAQVMWLCARCGRESGAKPFDVHPLNETDYDTQWSDETAEYFIEQINEIIGRLRREVGEE
jgi:hypothetical protein